MEITGEHLLVEYWDCEADVLDDLAIIEAGMRVAAVAAGASVVASVFQPRVPHGVMGVVLVGESHLSIHTWPEERYAAVDFYTCGSPRAERAHDVLKEVLRAERSDIMLVKRGTEAGLLMHREERGVGRWLPEIVADDAMVSEHDLRG